MVAGGISYRFFASTMFIFGAATLTRDYPNTRTSKILGSLFQTVARCPLFFRLIARFNFCPVYCFGVFFDTLCDGLQYSALFPGWPQGWGDLSMGCKTTELPH